MPPRKLPDVNRIRDTLLSRVFQRRFSGMDWDTSKAIQKYLVRAIANNYDEDRVVAYITRKHPGTSEGDAKNIWRTERHELANTIREAAFRTTEDEDAKYEWVGPSDSRTTTICRRIKQRVNAKKGVTIEELKEIIQAEVDEAKARGELDAGYGGRDFSPHYNCRHVLNRKY